MFAILEVAIGGTALASPALLDAASPAYRALSALAGEHALVRAAAQFVLSSVFLFVPAFLMGATLPALARAVVPPSDPGRGLASVYAANTLGAAAGAFAAGFLLIPTLGLRTTIAVAALLNVGNGVIAWTRMTRGPAEPPDGGCDPGFDRGAHG